MQHSASDATPRRLSPATRLSIISVVAISIFRPAASHAASGMLMPYSAVLLPAEDEPSGASASPLTDHTRGELDSEEALLRLVHPSVYAAHFQVREVEQISLAGGAYRYYRGSAGRGAIYYSPHSVRGRAVSIYGAVLRYFERHGREWWAGRYPLAAEQRAWGSCRKRGGQTQQLFSTVRTRRSRPGPVMIADQEFLTLCAANGRVWPLWTQLGDL
ncbi:MAG: hypothetical protein JWN04_5004 [Myxococcaceae bacterium]|nr:hypothetical protein [Myxococcaceae bacterium]